MLHDWPYQEDCLTPEGYVVLPPQQASEPPPARALRTRTHCAEGHEFTPENTIITVTGRRCVTCLLFTVLPRQARRDAVQGRLWRDLPQRGV